jgi:signal transduction histidine kinase
VRIDVRDQGRGIEPADMERIFEPFERGVATGELKGLGLGLYISRQLAASHGGNLTVASEVGKGSTFTLVLPCADKLTASVTADVTSAAA